MPILRTLFVVLMSFFLSSLAHASMLGMNPNPPAPSPHQAATIVFPQPPSPAYAGTSVTLTATSSNGLPIAYTVISGPAAVSGTTLTYSGVGTVVVEADQAGDASNPPAQSVRDTINTKILTEPLTASSPVIETVVTFLQAGVLGSINVSSQGASNLDFAPAPGGSCAVGNTYNAGDTCVASFTFTPQRPGLRFGGITFSASDGTLLANSYIVGLGKGPQILFTPPNQVNVGTGFGGLSGVAVDGSGNVYASDILGSGIYQVSAATGATRLIATTLSTTDVAVDGSGDVFYGDRQKVYEIVAVNGSIPQTPVIRTLIDGFVSIDGLKVDGFGDVFIAEGGSSNSPSSIAELQAVNGSIPAPATARPLISGVGEPTGVAVDISGDVFFSDEDSHSVQEIVADNGVIPSSPQVRVVSDAFSLPTNVTMDVSGNVYVPDSGTRDVKELLAVDGVLPASPTIISRGQGLMQPEGATVDASGDLFIADRSVDHVVELAYGAPPTLTFAAAQIGSTSSDSPKTLTIMNGGNADLTFPPPLIGTNPAITPSFGLDSSSRCPSVTNTSATGVLAEDDTCTFAINFIPLEQGLINGQLVLTDNNQGVLNATQTILLVGTGLPIPPTITFTVPNHTYGDPPFTVSATSDSAGAFTYSVISGPAMIAGSTVTLTGAGTVVLQAAQAANGNYASGVQDASFTVAREAQTITFQALPSPVPFGSGPFTLVATSSSGLPVVFSVISGPGALSGNQLSLTAGGTVVVAADQPGNTNYAPAPQVRQTITVEFGPSSVVLTATPTAVFLLNPVRLSAVVTGGGGTPSGTVEFVEGSTVLGGAVIASGSATLSLSSLALGSHTIRAIYDGDQDFGTATSAGVTVLVLDFKLAIASPSVTITHGGTAIYSIVVTPIGGSTMPADIQLSMNGGPAYAQSSFSSVIVPAGSGQSVLTLTVQTPNFPSGEHARLARARSGMQLACLSLGIAALAFRRKRRTLRHPIFLAAALTFGAVAASSLTGCGEGWRTQSWPLTVIAKSGALTHIAQGTLISRCSNGQDACSIQ